MMEPSEESVKRYIQQAQEFLSDSTALFEQGRFRSSVDRSYYSMHYCVLALLIHLDVRPPRSHRGLVNLFSSEVIQKGIMDREFSKMLSTAIEGRMDSTYLGKPDITFEDTETNLTNARLFLENVREILKFDEDI